MKLSSLTPIAAALAVSLSTAATAEGTSAPATPQPSSVQGMAEGKCGDMTSGQPARGGEADAKAKEEADKAREGKCGGNKRRHSAKVQPQKPAISGAAVPATGGKAMKEGQCGEGKCGSKRKPAN